MRVKLVCLNEIQTSNNFLVMCNVITCKLRASFYFSQAFSWACDSFELVSVEQFWIFWCWNNFSFPLQVHWNVVVIAAYLPSRQTWIGTYSKTCGPHVISLGVSQTDLYWVFQYQLRACPHVPQLQGNGLDKELRDQSYTLGLLDVSKLRSIQEWYFSILSSSFLPFIWEWPLDDISVWTK